MGKNLNTAYCVVGGLSSMAIDVSLKKERKKGDVYAMENKEVALIFGATFGGILFLALSLFFLPLASIVGRVLGICLLAGGGIFVSFIPLMIERKNRKKEG